MNVINQFYQPINGRTIEDLGQIIREVDDNAEHKDFLRGLEVDLETLQAAIASGDHEGAAKALQELRSKAAAAGYTEDDALTQILLSVDPQGLSERTTPFAPDELTAWELFFGDLGRALKRENDLHSDVTSRTQTELNAKADLLRKGEMMISNTTSRWGKSVDQAVQNLKA